MNTQAATVALIGASGMVVAISCVRETTVLVEDHCANQDGNAWCEQRHGGERPYCVIGVCGPTLDRDGCVEALPEAECYSPCGNLLTVDDDASCIDGSSSSSGSGSGDSGESSDSGESTTTGPQPCVGDEECPDGAAPFCNPVGECVGCDGLDEPDAACADTDASQPLCVGGTCVACTADDAGACGGLTPVCDDASNTCVGCSEHGQCGDAACNLFTGACLPADAVVHVGGPTPDFATIGDAVSSFDAGAEGTIVVHQANYDEAVTVDGARVLAFLANEGDLPLWILAGGGSPQLTVGDGTVLMDGMQLSGNASSMEPGLRVDAGRAWVDRSRVVDNNGGGIVAENAGELVLRNCFVGGDVNDVNALEIDEASARVVYSTLGAGSVTAVGLACSTPVSVDVRNSLIVSRGVDATGGFDLTCDDATVSYTATESMVSGEGNSALGDMPTTMPELWFMDYGAGNFHLTNPPITVATTAQWQDGDPETDIDGDARPTVDGFADAAGADVP